WFVFSGPLAPPVRVRAGSSEEPRVEVPCAEKYPSFPPVKRQAKKILRVVEMLMRQLAISEDDS
ncbi:hypothetical protein OJ996_19745, partial [Luteolibacter sp. GHJ8]